MSHAKNERRLVGHEFYENISLASDRQGMLSVDDSPQSEQSKVSTPVVTEHKALSGTVKFAKSSIPCCKGLPEIYACLFCQKTFGRKGDWKRHEGTLHELQKEWRCRESGCNRRFLARNKFRRHHESDHGCDDCRHDSDPAIMTSIQTASAWGCGFCVTVLLTWDERVNHIGNHFESGSKRREWDFSTVVRSLLLQPGTREAWQTLLVRKHGPLSANWPLFEWRVNSCHELLRALRGLMPVLDTARTVHLAYLLGKPTEFLLEPEMTAPGPFENEPLDSAMCHDVRSVEVAPFDVFAPSPISETFKVQTTPSTCSDTPADASLHNQSSLAERVNFDEYFTAPNDYMAPCPETFQPTAWSMWPDPLDPFKCP